MSQDNSNNNSSSNLSDNNSSERINTSHANFDSLDSQLQNSPYQRHLLPLNNSQNNMSNSIPNNSSNASVNSQKPILLHQQLPKLNTNSGAISQNSFSQPPNLSAMGSAINLSPTLNGQPTSRKSSFIGNINTSPISGLASTSNVANSITQLSLNTSKPGNGVNNNVSNINGGAGGNTVPNTNSVFPIKIRQVPTDLSSREMYAIFSLANNFIGADLLYDQDNIPVVYAKFASANDATSVGRSLDGKQIFGLKYAPVRVDFDELNNVLQQIAFNNATVAAAPTAAPDFGGANYNNNPSNPNGNISANNNLISPGVGGPSLYSNLQSPSTLSQQIMVLKKRHSSTASASRSRFLFNNNDFNGDKISGPIDLPLATPTTANAGKSLLMMEARADANEYEQLVRDPWNNNGNQNSGNANHGNAGPSQNAEVPSTVNAQLMGTLGGSNLGSNLNSQPSTPIGFEWGSLNENNGRRTSSSFFPNGLKSSELPSLMPQSLGKRNTLTNNTSPPNNLSALAGSSGVNGIISHPQQQPQQPQQQQRQPQQQQSQPQQQQQQQQAQSPTLGQQANLPVSNINSVAGGNIPASGANQSGVDLSLLARVPLPSNPADQNPPCNTLYVGNLPPDATEAELRALFSPQKGFRRLSFKNKAPNSSSAGSHSHGPMCFVEFEDVGYATRALAELYGSALPRPGGVSNKGGIRLSFSKNPLGVRGPGQRRGSSNLNNFQNYNAAAAAAAQQQQQVLQSFPQQAPGQQSISGPSQPQLPSQAQQQHQQPPQLQQQQSSSQIQTSQNGIQIMNSGSLPNQTQLV